MSEFWMGFLWSLFLSWVGVGGLSKVVATFNHVGGSFNLFMVTTGNVFSNLGLCAACWAHFMCHHELWPTSVSHPFSFLNSSLGLARGNITKQGKSEGFESCDRPIVWKRPIWVKFGDVLSRVTLKFDGWPWKTIGHLPFAVSSFVQHFIAIVEFKLELQFDEF